MANTTRGGMTCICAGVSALLFAVAAGAVPVGSSAPLPGFGVDSGHELFVPNDVVVTFEVADLLGAAALNEFSFYFASDPGTLIPIFAADDQGPPDQGGSIDFVNGSVLDLDASVVQSTFTPMDEAIGFAFKFDFAPDVAGGEGIAFSQVAYTGGVDAIGTYPSLDDPTNVLITLELNDTLYAIEIAQGIQPIPEPSTLLLVCAGFLALGARARRSRES